MWLSNVLLQLLMVMCSAFCSGRGAAAAAAVCYKFAAAAVRLAQIAGLPGSPVCLLVSMSIAR